MAATPGNKFWLARATHGRDKIFSTPDILWGACLEYFAYCQDNPLGEAIVYQGELSKKDDVLETKPLMRAMTQDGLCTFLGICSSTWKNYRGKDEYKDFLPIIERAEQVMRDQKFTGAAAGLLNPNIIARDLGLADKKEVDVSGIAINIDKADAEL